MKKEFVILASIIVLSFKASSVIAAPRSVYVDSDTDCVPKIEDNLIAYGGAPPFAFACQDLLTVWVKNPKSPPAGTRLIFSHNGLPIAVTEPGFKEQACQKNNSLYWLTVLDPYDLDHDNVACDGAAETDCLFEKDDGSPETFSVAILFPNDEGGYDEIGTDTFEFEFIDCSK
jgi:hypothetical protein